MELDDLKEQWKLSAEPLSNDKIREVLAGKISKLERSGRGIRRAFWIEMAFVWGLYSVAVVSMIFFKEHILPYMYKIVVVIGVTSLPILWRLYKSQRWASSMDYSMDMRSNIVAFIKYYKRSLLLYEWTTYVIVLLTFGMMYFDPVFHVVAMKVKWIFFGYLVFILAITRPYIHYVYGRKVASFEDFLRD